MWLVVPLVFLVIGAWLALFVRGLIAEHAHRRIELAAEEALTPDQIGRLRIYIAAMDAHERDRLSA